MTIIIWRPYVDIKQSVKTFSDLQLYRLGCIQVPLILERFEQKLAEPNFSHPIFFGKFVKYYWNGGAPFLADLLDYFRFARQAWKSVGGEPVFQNKAVLKKLSNSLYVNDRAPWTEDQARNHRFSLMLLDYFWWKRHFRSEKEYLRKLYTLNLFDEDVPASISKANVYDLTYLLDNPD